MPRRATSLPMVLPSPVSACGVASLPRTASGSSSGVRTSAVDVVRFDLGPYESTMHTVTPAINDESLVDLVADYEVGMQFDHPGGYGGLVPEYRQRFDLSAYLMGEDASAYEESFQTLGCQCGEWGCWPLATRITVTDRLVTWDRFAQPHRRGRDYRGFGPFVFEVGQYRDAVFDVFAALSSG
jgi:hypothetical protein